VVDELVAVEQGREGEEDGAEEGEGEGGGVAGGVVVSAGWEEEGWRAGKGGRGERWSRGTVPVDDERGVVGAVRVGEVGVDVVFAWVGHGGRFSGYSSSGTLFVSSDSLKCKSNKVARKR